MSLLSALPMSLLASSSVDDQNAAAAAGGAAFFLIMMVVVIVISLVFYLVFALSCKKILEKAGQPGWPGFVPVYNIWRLFEISGKPGALSLILLVGLIPFLGGIAGLIVSILLAINLGKAFNKSTGFVVGMVLLGIVFYPMLAFGDSTYQPQALGGPAGGFPVGPGQR